MNDLSLLRLIAEATIVVQSVMLLLLAASVYAWVIVFRKHAVLRGAKATLARFERESAAGDDLAKHYRAIESRGDADGIEAVFQAGLREFARLRQQGEEAPDMLLEGARRAMKARQIKEVEHLEQHLSTLATVGPGIAEALIATAMGLLAAIPAVIFYNRFSDQVWRLESRYDAFIEEFSTILQRRAPRAGG